MSFTSRLKDLFLPWFALEDARDQIGELEFTVAEQARSVSTYRTALQEQEGELSKLKTDINLLRWQADRDARIIKRGHFRNPATGRLGRKGELFPEAAARKTKVKI